MSLKVPASTSNLGPGFDLLGLALGLFLEVRVLEGPRRPGEHHLTRSGEGAESFRGTERDLLLEGLERGRALFPFEGALDLVVHSDIPLGRGLGSSGAATVAGLLLARALGRPQAARNALLGPAITLEGHPDNAAASLYGGATLCAPLASGSYRSLPQAVHPSLGVAVVWPPEPLSTARSRAALPLRVPHADAVANSQALALLLEGLRRGDGELLSSGLRDRLHVPYRLPLLPGAEQAMRAATDAGAYGATLSGAGSGLVALGPADRMEPIRAALETTLARSTGSATARVLEIERQPPRVVLDQAGGGA